MAEKLNYPLKFDKCPLCGETKHVARTIADELVEKGTMTPGMPAGTNLGAVTIKDPTKTVLTAPNILKVYDICARCGHEHVVYVNCKETPVLAQVPPDPNQFPFYPSKQ